MCLHISSGDGSKLFSRISSRFVAVGATAATGTACVILLANIIKDKSTHTFVEEEVDFTSFFMAFGTICFAFGGHPAFPTFQADMRNQKNFGKAVLLGYISKHIINYFLVLILIVKMLPNFHKKRHSNLFAHILRN